MFTRFAVYFSTQTLAWIGYISATSMIRVHGLARKEARKLGATRWIVLERGGVTKKRLPTRIRPPFETSDIQESP